MRRKTRRGRHVDRKNQLWKISLLLPDTLLRRVQTGEVVAPIAADPTSDVYFARAPEV